MTMQSHSTLAIPKHLIYEMDEGKPIYYRGYEDVLKGKKHFEQVMSDSTIQAWLKMKIGAYLLSLIAPSYDITVGEQGISFSKGNWRGIDIAIFNFEDVVLDHHYSKKVPVVAIEIDTKSDFKDVEDMVIYYEKKIARLFEYGVERILWIFTGSQKIQLIEPTGKRHIFEWTEDVPVVEDVKLNIAEVFKKYRRELPPKPDIAVNGEGE
ncbi:MAG: hypothetical protein AAB316_12330 [Bacteroidota bacterium]